jgi:hypothetical protein
MVQFMKENFIAIILRDLGNIFGMILNNMKGTGKIIK